LNPPAFPDLSEVLKNVRFAPKNRHRLAQSNVRKGARSGLTGA
jgi:hypothetical protein